jgi:hypothetical protein
MENPMNTALAKALMTMAFPSTPQQSPDTIRTSVPPEEFDLTPRLPEVPELPESSDPLSPGGGDVPPRCREECESLRDELRREEEESRRRMGEADAQFAELRRRLDDLLIEKEDLAKDRDQWIVWHTEEADELHGAEQKLERHEDELHRAKASSPHPSQRRGTRSAKPRS